MPTDFEINSTGHRLPDQKHLFMLNLSKINEIFYLKLGQIQWNGRELNNKRNTLKKEKRIVNPDAVVLFTKITLLS